MRLLGWTRGIHWFTDYPKCGADVTSDCVSPYNEEFVDPIKESVRKVLASLIIISALFCVICFKKRSLANAFMVIECLVQISVVFVPFPKTGSYELYD